MYCAIFDQFLGRSVLLVIWLLGHKKVLMSRLIKVPKMHKGKEVYLHRPVRLAMLKNEMTGRLHINRKPELQSEVKSIQAN